MTNEEPKVLIDSNTLIEIKRYLDKCQNLEQMKNEILYNTYMAGVNMAGEYQGCWVRFKDIENIVNNIFKYNRWEINK